MAGTYLLFAILVIETCAHLPYEACKRHGIRGNQYSIRHTTIASRDYASPRFRSRIEQSATEPPNVKVLCRVRKLSLALELTYFCPQEFAPAV